MPANSSNILHQDDLPPKPAPPQGRAVFWVEVICEGVVHYKEQAFLVNAKFIDTLIERHWKLTASGYQPPLTANHPDGLHPDSDGESAPAMLEELIRVGGECRVGDILQMRRWAIDGKDRLLAAVSPCVSADEADEALRMGLLRYTSPGFGPVQMPDGEIIPFAMRELSTVPRPHLKTGPTHFLGSAPDIDPIAPMEVMEEGDEEDEEDEEESEGAKMSAVEIDLRKRLEVLEQEKEAHKQALFKAALPTGAKLTIEEGDSSWLYALRQNDPELFGAIKDRLAAPEQPKAKAAVMSAWDAPRGTSAPVEPQQERKLTKEELRALPYEEYRELCMNGKA